VKKYQDDETVRRKWKIRQRLRSAKIFFRTSRVPIPELSYARRATRKNENNFYAVFKVFFSTL